MVIKEKFEYFKLSMDGEVTEMSKHDEDKTLEHID